jgi:hypothetical protein
MIQNKVKPATILLGEFESIGELQPHIISKGPNMGETSTKSNGSIDTQTTNSSGTATFSVLLNPLFGLEKRIVGAGLLTKKQYLPAKLSKYNAFFTCQHFGATTAISIYYKRLKGVSVVGVVGVGVYRKYIR